MTLDRMFNIAAAIVGVALVTTLVAHRNTATVVTAVGNAFGNSLRAAMGSAATSG